MTEGETAFIFDGPGVLLVDARNDRAAFPTIQGEFAFSDRPEFLTFMKDVLNAKLYPNDVNPDGFELEVRMFGKPWMYDSLTSTVIPVNDPLTTFLGGETGFLTIEGKRECVNLDICGNQGPLEAYGATTVAGGLLGLEPGDSNSLTAAMDPLEIKGASQIGSLVYSWPDWTALRGFYAETKLVSGGYNKLIFNFSADPGKPFECIYIRDLCYIKQPWKLFTIKRGNSTLFVKMMTVEWNPNNSDPCPIRRIATFEEKVENESSVSVFICGTSEPYGVHSPSFYADGLFSRHAGFDLDTYDSDSTETWVGAGSSHSSVCSF